MYEMDWTSFWVIGVGMGAVRLIWAILKAWAREPLQRAKIEELMGLVETLSSGMERVEAAHQAEREAWERSRGSSCERPMNHEVSVATTTSSAPKPS